MIAWLVLWVSLALADPGADIVVVLDNSCSMSNSFPFSDGTTTEQVPAQDPERLAVLATLAVQALGTGNDNVTVLSFGDSEKAAARTASSPADVREWRSANGTWFREPLKEATRLLEASRKASRFLLFLTDGVPSDLASPDELRAVFDPTSHPTIDVLSVGLFRHPKIEVAGSRYLEAIVHDAATDFRKVTDPAEVVGAFTEGFARAIGSRPETGFLDAGDDHSFTVGRYVSEVIIITVSRSAEKAYQALLGGPSGAVKPVATGDNGCSWCTSPVRQYAVFKTPNDPDRTGTYTLELEAGKGIEFGVILRYDLRAVADAPAQVESGTQITLRAHLDFKGQVFDDEEFFSNDDFRVAASVGGEEITLTHAGAGQFEATWVPTDPGPEPRTQLLEVTFTNSWIQQTAVAEVLVLPPPYLLVLHPNRLDLDPIPSSWERRSLCQDLDLGQSENIADKELSCDFANRPLGLDLSCERVDPMTLRVCAFTERWCCEKTAEAQVTVAGPGGSPPRTASVVPIGLHVDDPGFLRCHWLAISLALSGVLGCVFAYGWIGPHSFDPDSTVATAGSEASLRRADQLVLQERPLGKRGWYRSAKLCLSIEGDALKSERGAAVVLEAGPKGTTRFKRAAGLETLERRTRSWRPLAEDELAAGFVPSLTYRVGDLYLRFD